jgi:hypothetical protein
MWFKTNSNAILPISHRYTYIANYRQKHLFSLIYPEKGSGFIQHSPLPVLSAKKRAIYIKHVDGSAYKLIL